LDYQRLLTDDYVQKKFLTVKYSGKGNFFDFSGKGTLDFKLGADKKEQPVTSSEVKLVTNVEGRNLETKFDSRGLIRVWGNFGTYKIGQPMIVTSKVKTNNAFNRFSGRLSLEYKGAQSNIFTSLHLKDGNAPYFSEKMVFNYNQIQTGYAVKLNLLAYTLARYNLYFAYNERDFGIVAEHVSRNKTKIELGKLILAATYRRAGNDYVLKASYRPYKADQFRFKLGTVAKLNKDTTVRAKINNNTKLTLSTKFRYNSNLTLVAGTQVNLLDPSSFATKKTIPIPLGLSVEFAYL
jgi:hypothetical protein